MRRLAAILGLVAISHLALLAGTARADGDPASDYLISQPVFLPFDTKVDKGTADELRSLLEASKTKGFEIRVALISGKTDLGAVPILYRKPELYARFLGQELFYWYKQKVLVVMPNGYGISQHGKAVATDLPVLARLPKPGTTDGTALANSAMRAVRALARKHDVTLPAVSARSSSSGVRWYWIVGAVIAAAAIAGSVAYVWRGRR